MARPLGERWAASSPEQRVDVAGVDARAPRRAVPAPRRGSACPRRAGTRRPGRGRLASPGLGHRRGRAPPEAAAPTPSTRIIISAPLGRVARGGGGGGGGYAAPLRRRSRVAQAEVCKTFYTGSIPVAASKSAQAPEVRRRGRGEGGRPAAPFAIAGSRSASTAAPNAPGATSPATAAPAADQEEHEGAEAEQHQEEAELRALLRLRMHLFERGRSLRSPIHAHPRSHLSRSRGRPRRSGSRGTGGTACSITAGLSISVRASLPALSSVPTVMRRHGRSFRAPLAARSAR